MNDMNDKNITVKKQTTNSYVFRPMLFSTPMVQAILEGRKTQTRRKIKHQPPKGNYKFGINVTGTRCKENGLFHWLGIDEEIEYRVTDSNQPYFKCPVNIGDIIWVKETFAPIENSNDFFYKADEGITVPFFDYQQKWKPSLFMPKVACRLFLEIENVRVELLQDISEDDAISEGIETSIVKSKIFQTYLGYKNYYFQDAEDEPYYRNPIDSYRSLWMSINGSASWEKNPFVWVYDFKVVECPERFL